MNTSVNINNRAGISSLIGVLMLISITVVMVVTFTKIYPLLSKQSEPLKAVVDIDTYYVEGLNKTVLVLRNLGGDPIPLNNLKIEFISKSGSKMYETTTGAGFVYLIGKYYRLNTTAMGDGNANNPDQVVLSKLVFTRNDRAIYFDWGDSGPRNDLTDYFAVIWEGQLKIVENGTYTFTLTSDDGSWLWIDGKLVINNGGLHGAQSMSNSTYLTKGVHHVKVMMYEWSGGACCRLSWSGPNVSSPTPMLIGETSKRILYAGDSAKIAVDLKTVDGVVVKIVYPPAKQVLFLKEVIPKVVKPKIGFIAYYYSDPSWNNLVTTRVESRIYFSSKEAGYPSDVPDWPKPIIGKNKSFSVRWVGYIYVPTDDNYTFYLTAEDNGWVYVDGQLVIENVKAGIQEVSNTIYLTKGYHRIDVLVSNSLGYPVAILQWNRGGFLKITNFLQGNWMGYYYDDEQWQVFNKTYLHNRLRLSDGEDTSAPWGSDINEWPKSIIGKTDCFSVIFNATIHFGEEGWYTFNLTSDDGSWLYIDGKLVIDNGGYHGPRSIWKPVHLTAGDHTFEVKMFEHTGGALIYLQYAKGYYSSKEPVVAYNY